ncbi:hypothetical protein [Alkalibacter mobilis]|uniref:hypothetical protein n=1 Tax=Alkalibacter mobilis TaxID=2787712 RepID=UPI00189D11CC|nr:hypothetical protein [Alkalibacter mobilis]MBF7097510.1 hypothetical protein [Alkalibacter mobilis]
MKALGIGLLILAIVMAGAGLAMGVFFSADDLDLNYSNGSVYDQNDRDYRDFSDRQYMMDRFYDDDDNRRYPGRMMGGGFWQDPLDEGEVLTEEKAIERVENHIQRFGDQYEIGEISKNDEGDYLATIIDKDSKDQVILLIVDSDTGYVYQQAN